MKFTLSWLRTHLDTDAPLDRITDTLTRIGLELEGVDRPRRRAGAVPHRPRDRGGAAPQRRPAARLHGGYRRRHRHGGVRRAERAHRHDGVFAPPGSFIPGTGITLKVGEIRGVQSAGMLLSAREMGLGEDHAGIMDLPADAPVGQPYAAWAGLDDPVIEIGVTPNRGDALQRARRGARPRRRRPRHAEAVVARRRFPPPSSGGPRWRIDWPAACPWILGRTIRGVRNGPSPAWLADRLTAIGLRPINALVDITNFFTFDLGRPLHVFDVGKLAGETLTLRAGAGETFRALNGKDVHRHARGLRHRRCRRRAIARRRHRRRGDRLRRRHHQRLRRMRAVRPGARRAHRPPPPDRLRRPPALRARRRPGPAARRDRSRDRA